MCSIITPNFYPILIRDPQNDGRYAIRGEIERRGRGAEETAHHAIYHTRCQRPAPHDIAIHNMSAPVMSSVVPLAFSPLPLGTIVPTAGSWMHAQLTAQRAGLCGRRWLGQLAWNSFPGHVADSAWVGGDGFGALEEAYPYWLNGALPMSILLMECCDEGDDAGVLLEEIEIGLDFIFDKAQENGGWLGPTVPDECPSPWASFRFCTALTMYIDAFGIGVGSGGDDQRRERADRAALALFLHASSLLLHLKANPLRSGSWEHSRWVEIMESYSFLMSTPYWMGTDQGQRDVVINLLKLAHEQGFDWPTWLESSQDKPFVANVTDIRGWFPNNTQDADDIGENKWQDKGIDRQWTHGVNLGQALSVYPLLYRLDAANTTWLEQGRSTMDRIMDLHGQASGVFTGDENLAGLEPNRGTETCAVVELMNALSNSFSAGGDIGYLDQLERVAYNALPAAFFNGTMSSLIYYQQMNKIDATNSPPKCKNDASTCQYCYGLLFECCVANHVQGWPKFVMRQIQLSSEGSLVITQYFSSETNRAIQLLRGITIGSLAIETDYPFSETVTVKLEGVSAPFQLEVRIPGWCKEAQVHVDGKILNANILPGAMHPIQIEIGSTTVELVLPMEMRIERRPDILPSVGVKIATNSANIFRGPILYAFSRDYRQDQGKVFDEVVANNYLLGTGNWQYGLIIDDDTNPSANMRYQKRNDVRPLPNGQGLFATTVVPDRIIAEAIVLNDDEWGVKRSGRGSIRECNDNSTSIPKYNSSWAGMIPRSPIPYADRVSVSIELVPYGSTDVRIAEFATTRTLCDQSSIK